MALLYTIVVGCIIKAWYLLGDITCNHIRYPTDHLILGNIRHTHGYHCPYPYPIFIPVPVPVTGLYPLSPHQKRVREKVRVQEATVERAQLYVFYRCCCTLSLAGQFRVWARAREDEDQGRA